MTHKLTYQLILQVISPFVFLAATQVSALTPAQIQECVKVQFQSAESIAELETDLLILTPFDEQTVVGLLNRSQDGSLAISPVNGGPATPLSLGTSTAVAQVKGLQNMDLLQGSAQTSAAGVVLSGVDFVGLNRLLGKWTSSTGDVYDFANFSNVVIGTSASLSYALSPQSNGSYNLFIAKNGQVALSILTFNQDGTVTLTDSSSSTSQTLTKIADKP